MTTLRCTCGETFFIGEVPRGAQLRCRRCSRTIDVQDALRTATAEPVESASKRKRRVKATGNVILPTPPSLMDRLLGPWRRRDNDAPVRDSRELRIVETWRRALRTPVGVGVTVYSVCMLLLFAYLYLRADTSAVGMLLSFSPRWWCLIPWVVLMPAAMYSGWRTSVVGVVGVALTLFGVAGFELPNLVPPTTTRRALRVVTYDTERATAVASRIRASITSWNADVVLLQNCSSQLADSLDAIEEFNVDVREGYCAVARLPLEGIDSMPPVRLPTDVVALRSARAMRAPGDSTAMVLVMRYHVRTALGIVPVYSTRLASEGRTIYSANPLDLKQLARNVDARSFASRMASQWISRVDSAFVVAGNFSLPTGSVILRRDWRGLTDAFGEMGTGFGHTMTVGYFAVRSDHVLVTPSLIVAGVRQYDGFPTSHQPVMVDLDWRD